MHVRPATTEDWDEIKRMCKDIWGGEDYVPDVFPRWIEASDCHPFVLEDRKKNCLRGVVNIRLIDQGETAWFEGIRVDPTYQGKGLGGILTNFIISWSKNNLPSVKRYRLMIAEDNHPSLNLAKKFGLKIIETSIYFRLNLDPSAPEWSAIRDALNLNLFTESDKKYHLISLEDSKDTVQEFYLHQWKSTVKNDALLNGWSFVTITRENVQQLLEQWSFLAMSSPNGTISGACGFRKEDDNEGKPFIRFLLHVPEALVLQAVKICLSHLKQHYPEIFTCKWHIQANGKMIESKLQDLKKSIDFFRFYLLERPP